MHYTEVQKSEIKRAFSDRRRKQWLLTAAFSPMIVAALLYSRGVTGTILGLSGQFGAPLFLALVVIAGIFSFRNWRCPGCSKYLGRAINPRHCPHCMVQLR